MRIDLITVSCIIFLGMRIINYLRLVLKNYSLVTVFFFIIYFDKSTGTIKLMKNEIVFLILLHLLKNFAVPNSKVCFFLLIVGIAF